jgi:hypothetical protein
VRPFQSTPDESDEHLSRRRRNIPRQPPPDRSKADPAFDVTATGKVRFDPIWMIYTRSGSQFALTRSDSRRLPSRGIYVSIHALSRGRNRNFSTTRFLVLSFSRKTFRKPRRNAVTGGDPFRSTNRPDCQRSRCQRKRTGFGAPVRDTARPLFRQLKCYCMTRECSSCFSKIRSVFWEPPLPISPSHAPVRLNRHRPKPFRSRDVNRLRKDACEPVAKRDADAATRTESPCPSPGLRFVVHSQTFAVRLLANRLRNGIPPSARPFCPADQVRPSRKATRNGDADPTGMAVRTLKDKTLRTLGKVIPSPGPNRSSCAECPKCRKNQVSEKFFGPIFGRVSERLFSGVPAAGSNRSNRAVMAPQGSRRDLGPCSRRLRRRKSLRTTDRGHGPVCRF